MLCERIQFGDLPKYTRHRSAHDPGLVMAGSGLLIISFLKIINGHRIILQLVSATLVSYYFFTLELLITQCYQNKQTKNLFSGSLNKSLSYILVQLS